MGLINQDQQPAVPPLSPQHLAKLKSSGLAEDQAQKLRHRSVSADEAKPLTGHALPGLLLGYANPTGKPYLVLTGKWANRPFARLRPDWELATQEQRDRYADDDGNLPKYLSPSGEGNRPYFSPLVDWPRIQRKKGQMVILTEGELKGDSGCAAGLPTIAGAGVTAFVDRNSRGEWRGGQGSSWDVEDEPPEDDRLPVARFLPELDDFGWEHRPVAVIFDSDLTSKFQVRKAAESLLTHVRARAGVGFLTLLPNELDGSKNGLDDFLVRHGAEALQLLIDSFWSMQHNRNAMAKYGPATKLKGGTKIMGGKKPDGQPHDGSEVCQLRVSEPEPHTKALMCWSVLKELWAYRPALGWYQWQGKRWEAMGGDATALGVEIGRFFDAQNWQQRNGALYAYCQDEMARRCFTAEDQWDSPHYLGFENGVLDTRDNQFHPHSPKFFCTTTLPYDYDPSADCPTWLNYLHQATGGDTKLQVLLQAWCKWAIVPKDRARKSPVEKSLDLVGRKGSGKGTFLDILIALVGENNIGSAAPETFASPEGLGQLIDKRLAIDTDVSGYMQGVGNFNKVVSNEPVGIKKLFKDKSMQRLGVVVVRSYNDFISVPSSGTEGLDRRLCIVPFKCPPAVPDHDLDIKLRAELPGIFAWAWGLSLAQAQAVIRWSGAIEAVQEVSIERFLNDHPEVKYLIDDYPTGKEAVQAYDLYEGYANWAKRNGHKACSNTKFGTLLNELGLVHFKGNGGVIFYHVPDMRNEFDLAAYLRISPKSTGDFPSELLQKSNFSSVQEASKVEPEGRSEGSEGRVSDPPKNEPLPERVSEGSEGWEGLATSPTIQKKVDQPLRTHVGIMAGATVYRHGGWKLPKPTLKALLGKDAIPLGAMPDWFQAELADGSWEVRFKSGDDTRTLLRNKQTGREVMVDSVSVYEVQIPDKTRA